VSETGGALRAWLRLQPDFERLIETPISEVYLFRDRVLKLKKAVDFGFLDFTTPDKRRWACEREVRLNRLNAPDIYRRALSFAPDGSGFAERALDDPAGVECAVEMRRFDEKAVLAENAGLLSPDLAEALGRDIARFHARAEKGAAGGGASGLLYVLNSNADQMRQLKAVLGEADVEALIAEAALAFERARARLDARQEQGFVRVCHGDMHLGNILIENGRGVLFDRIEFNDRLIEIDILYDFAFLVMDLVFRGHAAEANRALGGWLDEAARHFPFEDLGLGLELLPLFLSVRAAVRCHVEGHNGAPERARAYLAAARAHLRPLEARLVLIGGLSGTGKTTLARAVAPHLGLAPGAVILRSDEVRKRLVGVAPTEPLPASAYGPDADAKVLATLEAEASLLLRAGRSVIWDATFRDEKARARAMALHASARGFWLEGPDDLLRARVAARRDDASDADLAVLEAQLQARRPVEDWPHVDVAASLEDQTRAVLAALG
jgi:hypothetical protein